MKKRFGVSMLALAIVALGIAALVSALSLGGTSAVSAAPPDTAISYHEGNVTEVDVTERSLTIQKADGTVHTWHAADSVDLDVVQIGDSVRIATRDDLGVVTNVAQITRSDQTSGY